jgi:hypothetical protein
MVMLKGCALSVQLDKLKAQFAQISPLQAKITDVLKSHVGDIDISGNSY